MRYLISISYDGSKYFGFQRLNNLDSIQKELEYALSKINKSKVIVKGSGRTDKGVHALNQKCHFDLNVNIPTKRLVQAMNSILPPSIYVNNCKIVDESFHARFSVKRKIYKYVINVGKYNAIKNDFIYNYCHNLNINSMRKASKILFGQHSYKNFVSGTRDNYDSEIYKISITKKNDYIIFTFEGKSFYRYMVRNIVGSLIEVGKNKISYNDYRNAFNSNKKINYTTAPANGLYLYNVKY